MEQKKLRHAWLIITHGNFSILEKQLRFLDSENADFYIHVDARAKSFAPEYYFSLAQRSRVIFTERSPVSWGDYSQIQCELTLLKAALPGQYDYYHLLSGVDVPIKSREYIESWFEEHRGKNFLQFHMEKLTQEFSDRMKYYYPIQRFNIQNRPIRTAIRRACILAERPFVNRVKDYPSDFIWQKGANWFSITHELAQYVVSKEDWIHDTFRSSFCCDEFFIQTLVMNSPFRSTLYREEYGLDHRSCLRYIDWHRGKPYTFTDGDTDELLHTGEEYLFARKFNYATDPQVVDTLFSHFGEERE